MKTSEEAQLTPCQRLGYKVGDRFRVVEDDCGNFDPGEIVYLIRDDGSSTPLFCTNPISDIYHEEAHYLRLSEVVPVTDQEQDEQEDDPAYLQATPAGGIRVDPTQGNNGMILRDGIPLQGGEPAVREQDPPYSGLPNESQRQEALAVSERIFRRRFL